MSESKVRGSVCVCVGGPVFYCGNQPSGMNLITSSNSSLNNKKGTLNTENNVLHRNDKREQHYSTNVSFKRLVSTGGTTLHAKSVYFIFFYVSRF